MKLILLFSAIAYVSSTHVKYKDCGSTSKVGFIDVDPCEVQPCSLKQGMNYTVHIQFNAGSAIKDVGVKIYGVVAGVPVPFPFSHPDACDDKGAGIACPLVSGQAYMYKATLPVLTSYPAIRLHVKWELVSKDADTKDKVLICGLIPVQVIKADHKEKDVRRIHWED